MNDKKKQKKEWNNKVDSANDNWLIKIARDLKPPEKINPKR